MPSPSFFAIFEELLQQHKPLKIIFSQPRIKTESKKRILTLKQERTLFWQEEEYRQNQVFHQNYDVPEQVLAWWQECSLIYKQAQVQTSEKEYHVFFQKDGSNRFTSTNRARTLEVQAHNRKKQYIMQEGTPIDFLIELGIMTKQGKIIQSKYDKFRQINRYLEIVSDCLPFLSDGKVRIIDFGCGKSYLTFALFWYLKQLQREIVIVGLDLKKDIVEHCNLLAQRLGYQGLHFQVGDIAQWQNQEPIDLVVSLHSCDTATDAALTQAIRWNAKVILAVPCCQHELAPQIINSEQNAILRHGILRERLASIITDALRAELLEAYGYQAQVMEFIDLEHTPKNLLIRGIKQQNMTKVEKAQENVSSLLQHYGLQEWAMLRFLEKDMKSGMPSP
jgi:2-polyprenyl-3-methyl-5-hydroxy-6-metoxy-1,4-benzoquinol methylase